MSMTKSAWRIAESDSSSPASESATVRHALPAKLVSLLEHGRGHRLYRDRNGRGRPYYRFHCLLEDREGRKRRQRVYLGNPPDEAIQWLRRMIARAAPPPSASPLVLDHERIAGLRRGLLSAKDQAGRLALRCGFWFQGWHLVRKVEHAGP